MIDLQKARLAFKAYVSHYDMMIPSIRLKVIHTYEVMKCSDYLCDQLGLSEEDKSIASLIALLHDIGRFEQWMRYESFADYKTIDHALFSSQLLFEEGLIRDFITCDDYDDIIQIAIEQHNRFEIEDGFDQRTQLFIHLIRDADKLDNFRVKDEEDIENILFVTIDEVNNEVISPKIYEQFYNKKLIYGPTRQTHLDMWLSYIAFIFDLHYDVSIQYIKEHDWVNRSFRRLCPTHQDVYQQYEILWQRALEFIG